MTRLAVLLAVAVLPCWAQGGPGGLPEGILRLQSTKKVEPPTLEAAIQIARATAREALSPLIDPEFHKGKRRAVPGDCRTIQAAIDASEAGDVVVVGPGTYFELLIMKDGVKLVSDSSDGGDRLVPVEGARLKLPARTLRTILDGSKATPSRHGMIDFNPGLGRHTIVDGFTIRNLPEQDHHIPGHAHGLNVRGASPVILNCYIHHNGSTGVGNHVVYKDQKAPIEKRDFRWANVAHKAEAVLYGNILCGNLGLGIGCNHFSAPVLLGNEIFNNNDAALGAPPSPGIGAKHGAAPVIAGNVVHDNPGGGILSKIGVPQGAHPIDRRTCPTVRSNVVFSNGETRPGISCGGGGTQERPVRFLGNFVYDSGAVGIGLSEGAVGIVEANVVRDSALAGVAIHGATALRLDRNQVTRAGAPGFLLTAGARILQMVGNASNSNRGPPFVVVDATIADPDE
ncbi:MAG: right-handed parallel beta-helix repeat-containing protein [Planctomycetota bacterium]|jgi:hypothetical protein